MMTEKYKILGKYIKDLSSETKDIETYLFVRDNISKYQLGIDITSKALKNKMIEVNTTFKFEDKDGNTVFIIDIARELLRENPPSKWEETITKKNPKEKIKIKILNI